MEHSDLIWIDNLSKTADHLKAMLAARGYHDPCVSIRFKDTDSWRRIEINMDYCPEPSEGRVYHTVSPERLSATDEDLDDISVWESDAAVFIACFEAAQTWIIRQPSRDEARQQKLVRLLEQARDLSTEVGVDIDIAEMLTATMKRLASNALTKR